MKGWIIMIECSANNLEKYYGGNKIFENISFELKSGEIVGLIGKNGSGKTTLMKILIGKENYINGVINYRKDVKLGYLDQIFKVDKDHTVIDILQSAFLDIMSIRNDMKRIEIDMKVLKGIELDKAMKSYSILEEEFELKGGYNTDVEIDIVCEGLNISDEFRNRKFENLSGGEKTRVMLGKLLLEKPDILLMDEPTNHLDIKSIEWLEDFLKEYKGAVLIISHDRVFLDKVVDRIMELKENKMEFYNGNYSYYIVEKEKRFEEEYKVYLSQQRKIDNMERQIERYRIWGAMRDSEKMYVRAKELEKRLDKIDRINKPDINNKRINLESDEVSRSGKIVLEIENLEKSFNNEKLFNNLNLDLFYQDKACIMGENGTGKSTILNIILGNVSSDRGNIKIGSSIEYGYLPQNIVFENEDISILEYFQNKYNLTITEARNELARVLFIQDDVYKKIKFLSGGEKTRLKLISLIHEKVNFMILDEPTNHLDIESREVLEEILLNYQGTILFVSHDRYFIEKIAKKMFILKDKKFKVYDMDYMEYVDKTQETKVVEAVVQKKEERLDKRPKKKKDRRQKIERLEKQIENLEEALALKETEMFDFSADAVKLNELYKDKEDIEKKLDDIMIEWAEIVDEYNS